MKTSRKNWLEWSVFAVGMVLTTGTIGFLAWDAATSTGAPPGIEVRLGSPRRSVAGGQESFVVPVTAINHGEQAAEGVSIEVSLERAGHQPEQAELEFAFLPRHSQREGSVTFADDPKGSHIKARVLGYEKP